MTNRRDRHCRRAGLVLLVVMVLIAVGALLGATMVAIADSRRVQVRYEMDQRLLETIARSGVRAVMSQLASQRDALLQGQEPQLNPSWIVFDDAGVRGEVRLVPFAEGGALTVAEGGRLNLSTAQESALRSFPSLPNADGILAVRAQGGSAEEILSNAGTPMPEVLEPDGAAGDPQVPVYDHLTVCSSDPAVQSGVGPTGDSRVGLRRVQYPSAWSEELKHALRQRLGSGVDALANANRRPSKPSELVSQLLNAGVPASEWADYLDIFSYSNAEFTPGLIDINHAPAAVIRTLPGVDDALAEHLVSHRGSLDSQAKMKITWPVTTGVLTTDQFRGVIDFIAARSLQWRVRVQAGVSRKSQTGTAEADGAGERSPPARETMTLEAVIDVGSRRARIASLRDMTLQSALCSGERFLAALDTASVDQGESAQKREKDAVTENSSQVEPVEREEPAPTHEKSLPGGRAGRWKGR